MDTQNIPQEKMFKNSKTKYDKSTYFDTIFLFHVHKNKNNHSKERNILEIM